MAEIDGEQHRVRVEVARAACTPGAIFGAWNELRGYCMDDIDVKFDENSKIKFLFSLASCNVKVTSAVGCGKPINWSKMSQADPELVRQLGLVDALEEAGGTVGAVGLEIRPELMETSTRASTPERASGASTDEFEFDDL